MTAKIKCAAYARVSTLLGQDPENQLVPIRQFSEARSFALVHEYIDKGISGSKERRAGLDELVRDARLGKFKVLIISGIDRLARDTRHLLNLIHELAGYGVAVISLRESIDFTSPMGQAALSIFGAMAQLEAELIRERIRNALAAKKLAAQHSGSDWSCGRPTVINDDVVKQVQELRAGGMSIRGIEKSLNRQVSRTTIARILKKEGNGE